MHQLRDALPDEAPVLGRIWHDAWHDGHAAHVPVSLTRLRTLDNFQARIGRMLDSTRVAIAAGSAVGFCTIKDDELYQIFVDAPARGSGAAAALLADGEARLKAAGVRTAWLACAVGNARAAAFYRKQGWTLTRTEFEDVVTSAGPFALRIWRFEKHLSKN